MSDCPLISSPCSTISILLIDDDDCLRSALAWSLREDGHEVLEYRAADQVPPVSELSSVAVVITDYDMPGMDGISFADAFHEAHPATPILLATGHPSPSVTAAVRARGFVRLWPKPLDYDALHDAIHAAPASVNPSSPAAAHSG